jgi:hypothetical protein
MGELKETQMILKSRIVSNFKDSVLTKVEDVPIGNNAAYKNLVGEANGYEFVNIVELGEDHPAMPDPWTKVVLTEEWAKSFVKAVKAVPKPMFIPGHADQGVGYKMRALPDGYIVGGLVQNDVLYLRNTMLQGITESQKALAEQTAKEIKAGMLSTSTSDYMKYKTEVDQDTGEVTYFAFESLKAQSNALVEADQVGSDAAIILTSFKADAGENDKKGEEQMGEKTLVATSAEQMLTLKNLIDSGRLALSEVASGLGIDVMTSKQKVALKRLNDAESTVGNITEFVAGTVKDKEDAFIVLKESAIKGKFETDVLIEIATPLFVLKEGNTEAIDAEVERVAGMKVFKSIQGKVAGAMNFVPSGSEQEINSETESTTMEG